MIPIVMARHIQSGLADYLETTFPMTNKPFQGSMRALSHQSGALTLDPFVSVKLPFRTAPDDEAFPFSECLHPAYRPYAHQMRAFKRIAAGESTLVATGTGSGKTECFLYPILAHCHRQRSRYQTPGIKAILVYPMNALAADQAKRLASLIHDSPELNGNITAGMYVGNASLGANSSSKRMTEDSIITDHDELLKNPPDILLTNYKMLDYLLIRPEDSRLWDDNVDEDTLKYFVVDELHTFDGAQGTDLACLLRRLTNRLHTNPDRLCCVGTSATMGTEDTMDAICEYASSIFNTTFTPDAVVTEDRLDAEEFFSDEESDDLITGAAIPEPAQAEHLIESETGIDPDAYLRAAIAAWTGEPAPDDINRPDFRVTLGTRLRRSRFLASLCSIIGSRPSQIDGGLVDELATLHARFAQLNPRQQRAAIDALVALVSHARSGEATHLRSFLDVQVQLWTKELRRMTADVVPLDGEVRYRPALKTAEQGTGHPLPVINCRDCGGTGWVGIAGKNGKISVDDMQQFYSVYFAFQSKNPFLVMQPCDLHTVAGSPYVGLEWFCNQCMRGQMVDHFDTAERECPECGTARIAMTIRSLDIVAKERKHYRCPFCGSDRSISLVGLRATPQISVMLSQLSADAFNDDDKTIVFSDSVQDASFRASAFNSRTWRFVLRNSAMDYITHQGMEDSTLADYLDGQTEYYHRRYADDTAYIVRFIAPNMTWMREYESMLDGNPAGPERKTLIGFIDRRLRMESLLEFGLLSRTGRTLAKSGCAALYFNPQKLAEAANRFRERSINELGIDDGTIHPDDWIRLLAGLLDLMRSSGAFFDQSYEQYLNGDANHILLSGKITGNWWMPGSYFDTLPRFLSTTQIGQQKDSYDTVDTPAYRRLAARYLTDSAITGDITRQLLTYALDACVDAGFVTRRDMPGRFGRKPVFGLNETACHIGTQVVQLACKSCGRTASCERHNLDAWDGARCPTGKCQGRLHAVESNGPTYYGKLYLSQPAPRIRAAEHTSLLDGDKRTRLEQQFKSATPAPGSANVLTCTPTLEMGIDIGDLSTVILASMPPAQAQYLQRAGRAGRRDGNSLVLAVANSKPHDLYFYMRPLDMIDGGVNPPHIFLEAPAVLERQFIAYALDHWVHELMSHGTKPSDIIPMKLKQCLTNVRNQTEGSFPFTLIDYVKSNATPLLDGFNALFASTQTDEDHSVRKSLTSFVYGTGVSDETHDDGKPLTVRLLDVFHEAIDTIDEFTEQRTQVEAVLADLESNPSDSAYEQRKHECQMEIGGIDNTIRSLNGTNTFNYLSDCGILPNYAFPESGVTLHTVLKGESTQADETDESRKTRKSGRGNLRTNDFVRPAASAITELAPGNTFYANGRKYEINRILFSKGDMDENTVMWRLCPNCSHAEPASNVTNIASCPSCGSPQWGDNGQLRAMLRIDTVISEEKDSDSLVNDSGDARTNTFFVCDALIDIDRDDIAAAWKIEKGHTDFAFEYAPHGTVRKINFGKAGVDGADMAIAGVKQVRNGFNVCVRCGALTDDKGHIRHSYACPNRTSLLHDDQQTKCLFLFRDLNTEMLRVLVPGIADSDGAGKDAESFTAAVMLGLRQRFGDVSHLAVTFSNEPLRNGSGLRKTYLVIYDTVPGGTGYLKQLADDPETFIDVLSAAAQTMADCPCEDGCYRCLYSYRQSRDLAKISKQTATAMVNDILEDRERLVRTETVADVPVNHLLDSKLEARFLEALRRLYEHPLAKDQQGRGRRAVMRQEVVRNKDGYKLSIGDSVWDVELQAEGSKLEHTPVILSKPDFLLHCVSDGNDSSDGASSDKDMPRRRDVAVFTDGLRFHAGTVAEDSAKRAALIRAGYRVWSFDYDDVERFLENPDDMQLFDSALNINGMPRRTAYRKWVELNHAAMLDPGQASAMAMLAFYLAEPDAERLFTTQAEGLGTAMFPKKPVDLSSEDRERMAHMDDAITGANNEYAKQTVFAFGNAARLRMYLGLVLGDDAKSVISYNALLFDDAIIGYDAAASKDEDDPLALLDEDDRVAFKREWSSFLHLINVMQFNDHFLFATTRGLSDDGEPYKPLRAQAVDRIAEQKTREAVGDAWAAILQETEDAAELHAAKTFAKHADSIPAPEPYYELVDEHDEVVGNATFAWADRKIAFVPDEYAQSDPENITAFEQQGWLILTQEDELVAAFTKEGKDN